MGTQDRFNFLTQNKVFRLQQFGANLSPHNPATSSDSASLRSKGARFVSAKMAIKNINAIGNRGKKFHTACWHSTIYVKLKEPENKISINIIEEKTNSYERS